MSKSKQAVLSTAARVLAKSPGASLGYIADAAGVSRATLHRQFESRKALLRELALSSMKEIDELTAGVPQDSAREMLKAVLDVVVPLGDRYHFLASESELHSDPVVVSEYRRQLKELSELIDAAKAEKVIAAEVPTIWVVHALDALIWAAWSAIDEGNIAPRDASGFVFRTLIDGVGARTS